MKVWFITGASRGFGALVTEEVLAKGDAVVATARRPEQLIERFGDHPNLVAVALDVTDEAEAHAAAKAAVERFGRIDVLLNNAGYGLLGAVEETSAQEVEALFRTNVFGMLAVSRAVLPHMRRQRSGRVINISSIGGVAASQGWGVYCATKFAVEGLTEAMAIELAPLGIQATVVEPGFFRTDFLDASSLVTSPTTIADYHETSGAMRNFARGANHAQPGDPSKLAKVLVDFADTPNPPVRLPLGSDTVSRIEKKIDGMTQVLRDWRAVSVSTDFDRATAA